MRKLSELIVQTGGWIYREMIAVFLFSAISSAVLVPVIFFLPAGTALILLPLLYAPLVAGVFYGCHRMLSGERAKVKDVFAGAVRFYVPSAVFGLLCSLFVLILASTWWYYGGRSGMWSWILAIFQTYFVAMFFVSQIYTLPLIVQEGENVFRAVGRSVKLSVTHPGYTFGAFLQLLCLTVVLGVTVIGFAFLFAGMTGIYTNLLTSNLLQKRDSDDGNDGKEEKAKDEWTLQGRSWNDGSRDVSGLNA